MKNRLIAGVGLLAFGLGTMVTFPTANVPGGDYEPAKVTAYLEQGHTLQSFATGYVGVAAAVALLVFGRGIRHELGDLGDTAWALMIVAAATSVVGWFIGEGVVVATAEGGQQITAGIPLPVAHTIGEIAGLLALCAPALCVGIVGILLWHNMLPTWLRAFSVVAGVCGILAPLFFTLFVFLLWSVVAGAWMVTSARRAAPDRSAAPMRSLV